MNIEDFRAFCLSLKSAQEKAPFGKANSDYDKGLLVFYVIDKWFCFVNMDKFDFCTIKCNPDEIVELQEKYDAAKPAYHMNKKHWISVSFNEDFPDMKIKELVQKSYSLVVDSLPKKERERIK